jgi:TonB-linked SusC/RagA family outer membrane protein
MRWTFLISYSAQNKIIMKIIPKHKLVSFLLAILLLPMSVSGVFAQQQTVSGTVKEADSNEPIVGATVKVKGSNIAVATDATGHFSIGAKLDDILICSFLGYATQEVSVGDGAALQILLASDVMHMNDVVVIGYGKTIKKEITGSISSLKEGDFSQGSFTSAAGLIQGKVAGVSIVNPSGGDPNAKYEILLRGTNTLLAGQGPLVIIDGVVGEDIRNINFQEVESVDVLKDGSAAAIYGARGTNGVVIITTKRARSGVTQVEYDGQLSVQTLARRAEPLTAEEFKWAIESYRPAAQNSLYGSQTDWFNAITRTPISHKHSLALSGGSEKFSHRTVLNVEQNQGLQQKNDVSKFLFKTNIHQKALNNWLDIDYNALWAKRKYSPANTDAFRQAFLHNPTEPIYDENNSKSGGYHTIDGTMEYYNPVAMINEQTAENEVDNMSVNARGTLNILPVEGLKWDNFVSYTQERGEYRTYRSHYYPSMLGANGRASIENSYYYTMQWESTLNYEKRLGNHNVQGLLGYTWSGGVSQSSYMQNGGFDNDKWLTNNIGAGSNLKDGLSEMSSYKENQKYIAFFGRLMYNYDEKYLLSASLRRDGSSRFGKNNKWGWFPALSVGWRINREAFLSELKWVDELKLRAGYGVTGNQDFPNYKSLLLMQAKGYFYYDGQWVNTYVPKSNANPDLRWEKKAEWNVGVDFSLFNNRLGGAVEYYMRNTTDLIYEYTVPVPPYDYGTMFTNVGELRNQGVEITLSAIPVQAKNFRWNTGLTFSHNTNKMEKFTDDVFTTSESRVGWLNTPMGAYSQRIKEGESLGSFYAPVWLNVGANGRDELKGAIAGSVSEANWEKIGVAYPDFMLGWSNSLTYKNWDFSMSLRASFGGKIFNTYRAYYENISVLGLNNMLNTWLDDTNFTGNATYSSKYIEDATYLKLDNLSLGYNLKINSLFIQRMRIYLVAQNVLCITKYKGVDPEVSLSGLYPGVEGVSYYPSTRMFTCGLNVTF